MKLFYFTRPDGISNFGDDLNPWLWNQWIPEELDEDPTTAFVGIGSILNGYLPARVPQASSLVVFSSGVGYGLGTRPPIDSRWKIYCVRGPLSAQHIGAPPTLAVTDGALLLRKRGFNPLPKVYPFSFMPHVEHAMTSDIFWKEACELAGIHYLDPRQSIDEVLLAISKTEILLAEAMHGAIVAEALRVPWIPIRTSQQILSFKWIDWCSSLGLSYNPVDIMPIIPEYKIATDQKNDTYDWVTSLYANKGLFSKFPWQTHRDRVVQQLKYITKNKAPNWAPDDKINSLTSELEERLDQFKQDVKNGLFRQR